MYLQEVYENVDLNIKFQEYDSTCHVRITYDLPWFYTILKLATY